MGGVPRTNIKCLPWKCKRKKASGIFSRKAGRSRVSTSIWTTQFLGRSSKKRPGLIALLNAAKAGEFDAVVVRDETRLGGDTFRSGLVIQDLIEGGTRLFYFFTNEEVKLDNAVDKFMIAARNFAAELEREKTSQRTHEHLMTKARRGLVVGGRVYGYDNLEVKEGDRRVRVEYRINEGQAAIVREIFTRYANGEGLRTLVKDLNARKIPAPRAGKRGTGSWSTSSIHEMVRRERYRGILVWGKKEKTYRCGTKVRISRAENAWIRADAPELRIINDELWGAVQARRNERKRVTGSSACGPKPKYLLSGLGRCGECGGPMRSDNRKIGRETIRVYNCAWHRDRGVSVCRNGLRRPVKAVDAAVVEWIRVNLLDEDTISNVLDELRERLANRTPNVTSEIPELERELRQVRGEMERLGAAIMSTKDAPTMLVEMLKEREKRLGELEEKLAHSRASPETPAIDMLNMDKMARERLRDLVSMMQRHPEAARKAIEAIVAGPLRFVPVETGQGRRYRIEGPMATGQMAVTECG